MINSHTPDRRKTPSAAVVQAVAEDTGSAEIDLEPLHDVVDPDALDALFKDRDNGKVVFRYAGRVVTVDASSDVHLEEADGGQL